MSQFHVRVSSRTLYERSPSSVCFIPAVQLRATIEVLSNDRLGLHFDFSQLRCFLQLLELKFKVQSACPNAGG